MEISELIKYLRQDVIYKGAKWKVTGLNTEKYLITIHNPYAYSDGKFYENVSPDDVVLLKNIDTASQLAQ
jgi:hypothetical protein